MTVPLFHLCVRRCMAHRSFSLLPMRRPRRLPPSPRPSSHMQLATLPAAPTPSLTHPTSDTRLCTPNSYCRWQAYGVALPIGQSLSTSRLPNLLRPARTTRSLWSAMARLSLLSSTRWSARLPTASSVSHVHVTCACGLHVSLQPCSFTASRAVISMPSCLCHRMHARGTRSVMTLPSRNNAYPWALARTQARAVRCLLSISSKSVYCKEWTLTLGV